MFYFARTRDGFVLVDIPDAGRAESFWRLIFGCRARSIVTFVDQEDGGGSIGIWSPPTVGLRKGDTRRFGAMRLDVIGVDRGSSALRIRTLRVTDEADKLATPRADGGGAGGGGGSVFVVRHFVFDGWTKTEPVPPREEFIRLIG